jgi:hypothetical protein
MLRRPGGGRGIGDGVEPHAARPGDDAVEKGLGLVSVQKAHQLSVAVDWFQGCHGKPRIMSKFSVGTKVS